MDEKRSARSIAVWLIAAATLLSLYLLSTGPAVLLRDQGLISRETFFRLYAPVGWLDRHVPFFSQLLELYLRFWSNQ